MHPYARGSWGPAEADRLLPSGDTWYNPLRVSRTQKYRSERIGDAMNDRDDERRVEIVGGGFAGLFAVRRLKHADASVTLIDRAQHHVFQPLLYQCATGIMSEGKIAAPLRDLLGKQKNTNCVMAEVVDFDVAGRRVLARRIGGDRLEFGYDDLIVAAGVRQSYFGHRRDVPGGRPG